MLSINSSLTLKTGRSRVETDTMNLQVKTHCAKRSTFCTCEERMEHLNDATNIETHQSKHSAMLPAICDEMITEPAK